MRPHSPFRSLDAAVLDAPAHGAQALARPAGAASGSDAAANRDFNRAAFTILGAMVSLILLLTALLVRTSFPQFHLTAGVQHPAQRAVISTTATAAAASPTD